MSLCIFDLDGTLMNTLPTIAHYGNSTLEQLGLPTASEEQYKYFIGNGLEVLIHRMLDACGSDTDELFRRAFRIYNSLYEADWLYLSSPYDCINNSLSTLKNSGFKLAVLSNKPDNVAKVIVADVFGDIFSEIRGKSADFPAKPDPTSALDICRALNEAPENTFFIGDTNVDIKTGKNAGFYTIGAEWGFRTADELRAAGADFVAKTPRELAPHILTATKKDA